MVSNKRKPIKIFQLNYNGNLNVEKNPDKVKNMEKILYFPGNINVTEDKEIKIDSDVKNNNLN